jgi:hypothetical protein
MAGRRVTELAEGRSGLLTGWHDRSRARSVEDDGPVGTLLSLGICEMLGVINRPGGNATGINILFTALIPKRIELLHAMAPQAATIGLLLNPKQPDGGGEEAARRLGLETVLWFMPRWRANSTPPLRPTRNARLAPCSLVLKTPFVASLHFC